MHRSILLQVFTAVISTLFLTTVYFGHREEIIVNKAIGELRAQAHQRGDSFWMDSMETLDRSVSRSLSRFQNVLYVIWIINGITIGVLLDRCFRDMRNERAKDVES